MKGLHLTYRHLVALGACEDRYEFQRRFGAEVLATVTVAVANAHKFNWYWIGGAALNPEGKAQMLAHWNEYSGGDWCCCSECDPDGIKRRFQAQAFAEAFLAQDGMAGRRPR